MKPFGPPLLSSLAALTLSACGGGSSSGSLQDFAQRYAALGANPNLASRTPDTTLNSKSGTAHYVGVINIGVDRVDTGSTSYYGNLNLAVNFSTATTADTFSGSAGGFTQFFSEIASPKNGKTVAGSLTINGNLTGDNETSIGSGLTGTASGAIDGQAVSYTVDGSVTGTNAEGMSLYFDDPGSLAGGVGLAVQ